MRHKTAHHYNFHLNMIGKLYKWRIIRRFPLVHSSSQWNVPCFITLKQLRQTSWLLFVLHQRQLQENVYWGEPSSGSSLVKVASIAIGGKRRKLAIIHLLRGHCSATRTGLQSFSKQHGSSCNGKLSKECKKEHIARANYPCDFVTFIEN